MKTSHEWFYLKRDQKIGPFGNQELQKLIDNGTLNRETLIWAEGLDEWVMAGQVTGLRFATATGGGVESKLRTGNEATLAHRARSDEKGGRNRKLLIFAMILRFGIIASLALFFLFWSLTHLTASDDKNLAFYRTLLEENHTAEGHLTGDFKESVSNHKSLGGRNTQFITYDPIYSFQVNGKSYTGVIERGFVPEKSADFEIHYIEEDPSRNSFDPSFLLTLELEGESTKVSRNRSYIWGGISLLFVVGLILVKKEISRREARIYKLAGSR